MIYKIVKMGKCKVLKERGKEWRCHICRIKIGACRHRQTPQQPHSCIRTESHILLRTAGITIYSGSFHNFQIILGDLFHAFAMEGKF